MVPPTGRTKLLAIARVCVKVAVVGVAVTWGRSATPMAPYSWAGLLSPEVKPLVTDAAPGLVLAEALTNCRPLCRHNSDCPPAFDVVIVCAFVP